MLFELYKKSEARPDETDTRREPFRQTLPSIRFDFCFMLHIGVTFTDYIKRKESTISPP